jgi:hypothetical protein
VPLTLGFFKPVILLPVAMANNLTLEQTEAILLHELAHIRRNDYLLNLGVAALELLFFFNPFSRLLINEVKREREHRCDDWVMQFRYDPHTYVSALLSLATHSPQRPLLTLAATGGGNDRLLLQRARRILRQKDARRQSANGSGYGDRPNARPVIFLLFTLAVTLAGERSQKPFSRQEQVPLSHTARVITTIQFTEFNKVWAAQRPPARIRVVNITLPAPKNQEAVARIALRKPRPAVTASTADPDQPTEEGEEDNDVVMAGSDANAPATETYATVIQPDNREYSIGSGPSITLVPAPESQKMKNESLPFVPHSSFSVQYMEDSTRPAEQLAYWQLSTQREMATALNKLQQDLAVQWRALEQKQAAEKQSNQATLQRFRGQRLKLQQQYLQKLETLQKKMEKANRRLRIVYI